MAFVLIAILRLLINGDELQQRIQLLTISFAAGTTALLTFSYGFLEGIGFPHFSTLWVLPIMTALWGLSLPSSRGDTNEEPAQGPARRVGLVAGRFGRPPESLTSDRQCHRDRQVSVAQLFDLKSEDISTSGARQAR